MGGRLILRSNWPIYLAEMVTAINAVVAEFGSEVGSETIVQFQKTIVAKFAEIDSVARSDPWTNFERKYVVADRTLYELSVELGIREPKEREDLLGHFCGGNSVDP